MGYPIGQVDISGLTKVSSTVEHVAAAFERVQAARADAFAPAGALDGWAAGLALPGTAQAWAALLKTLAGQVRAVGADLSQAARDYQAADDAAAGRLTSGYPKAPR